MEVCKLFFIKVYRTIFILLVISEMNINQEVEELNDYQNKLQICSFIVCGILPWIGISSIFIFNPNPKTHDEIEARNIMIGFYLLIQILACCSIGVYCIEYNIIKSSSQQSQYPSHIVEAPVQRSSISPTIQVVISPDIKKYQEELNKTHPDHIQCISCWENVRSVKLNCGHAILCHICAKQLNARNLPCPICREKITEIKEEVFSDKDYSPSISGTPPLEEDILVNI